MDCNFKPTLDSRQFTWPRLKLNKNDWVARLKMNRALTDFNEKMELAYQYCLSMTRTHEDQPGRYGFDFDQDTNHETNQDVRILTSTRAPTTKTNQDVRIWLRPGHEPRDQPGRTDFDFDQGTNHKDQPGRTDFDFDQGTNHKDQPGRTDFDFDQGTNHETNQDVRIWLRPGYQPRNHSGGSLEGKSFCFCYKNIVRGEINYKISILGCFYNVQVFFGGKKTERISK